MTRFSSAWSQGGMLPVMVDHFNCKEDTVNDHDRSYIVGLIMIEKQCGRHQVMKAG